MIAWNAIVGTVFYEDDQATVWHGDCLDNLREMPDNSVDAIVTDPPYGLGFMGKGWDDLPPGLPWAQECLRVLKPGGHLLAFGGTRTWHRLAVAVEDAGFEMRDSIAWLHGQGFPKGKSQLKPAFEPIVVARKPLVGTVAANIQAHGTGAINVDGCRVEGRERTNYGLSTATRTHGGVYGAPTAPADFDASKGRWPANVLLDGDAAEGVGEESRFFPVFKYQAKAPARERPTVVAEDGTKTSHPTVKPLALMRWLVRLVTPPGGLVLDPFAGSGTTVEAAILEGFQVIGIEREADYLPLIEARIARNRLTDEGLPAVANALALFDFEEPA